MIGGVSALVHMVVFAVMRPYFFPELANALGFIVAFSISFIGHRRLSFQDSRTNKRTSLNRFALTALAGFFTNELVFSVALRNLGAPDLIALFASLITTAGQTFVLSRFWAFRR